MHYWCFRLWLLGIGLWDWDWVGLVDTWLLCFFTMLYENTDY